MKQTALEWLAVLIFCGCQQETVNKAEESYRPQHEIFIGVHYQIIEIDNCEYIIGRDNDGYNGGYFLSHKGNCKFCTKHSKK